MVTLHVNVNKFLGTFSDVINMMMDVRLLSSHVFSYSVAQDMSNMTVEERHLQVFVKFLKEAKDMLHLLSNQMSHNRSKEGFEDVVLGFERRQSMVTDQMNVGSGCNSENKSHDNTFSTSCGTTTYAQMKTSSELDIRFGAAAQQQYGSLNEATCEIPSSRFSRLNDSQYSAADALSRSRHYSVPDNRSCYDMTASAVGHENSLSSHSAAFNLQNHMVVNSHFQPSCESAFNGSSNQMMRFPSCSRDAALKQYSSTNEPQSHESQYVPHDKTQNFTSKPSCEFAHDSQQHFTSPCGHFSPTAESNCDTLYASRCETTQDAHFSCDTSYETSNHSGHGVHTSSVPFQTTNEQPLNNHYSHTSLTGEPSFSDPSKTQHGSAFSMVNAMSTTQYAPCQGANDKVAFATNDNAQSKMHYPHRNDMCDTPFPQMNSNSNFVGINNGTCNTHVSSRVTETRYSHVSSFKWDVLSDTDDSYDPNSPIQPSNQNQDNTEFENLELSFSSQVNKNVSVNDIKRNITPKVVTPGENSFSSLLGTRDDRSSEDTSKKKLTILDGAKQEGGKWKCPLCSKLFIARVNLERHFNVSHLGEKGFPCNLCDKGFSSKIRLDAHLMRQHNLACDAANPCPVCGKLFNTKSALKTHSLTHVDESKKPFACNMCNKRFSQKVVLDTHLIRHGGPATYKFQCKVCSKTFPTKPKLKFHWRKHENFQFSCKECPKQFHNETHLRAHEATHIDFSQRPYQCAECPKTFTTKHKLQLHMETHGQVTQYSCTECTAVFKCRSTLVAHTRKCHPKSESHHPNSLTDCSDSNALFPSSQITQLENSKELAPSSTFECSICLKSFSRKSNLRQHELSCHQDVPQRFSCDLCPKRFKSKAKLKIHQATHTEEPRLSCTTCGKRFYRSDLLRTHEATHTGNKPFSCDVCARRFATQAMLRSHQVIHQPQPETVDEVLCSTCGKKFKNKRSLALHVKCHAESLEFKCGTCGKQFARRVHYDGHMRTHSADRPYSCTVCNRTFRERKHRADHMRRLHPNEILGGGELTLQKLIDSITADDTLDASTAGGSFETDVNSDALASLTELSNSGMQQLLEESSQRNTDSHVDDTSQSQGSQLNSSFGPQSRVLTIDSQVENVNQNAQVNPILSQAFTSQTHNVNLDCQSNITAPTQMNHLSEPFSSQSQNLAILQNPFHHLKRTETEPLPFGCSGSGELNALPELSVQLQSMETHSGSHSRLHSHFGHNCEGSKTADATSDESLPKLADVLAISMQGEL